MNKLRIGVILPDNMVPAWVRRMLENIKASPHAEISALAFADYSSPTTTSKRQYQLQFNLDRKVFNPQPDPWEVSDVRKVLQNTQVLGVDLHERLSRLKAMRIDLLLNLSLENFPKSLLDVGRFGAWSLRCNDVRVTAGSEIGWLEILNDIPLMHCDVEIQRQDSTRVFNGSVIATNPSSITLNQKSFFWRAALVVPRALKELNTRGEQVFFGKTNEAAPAAKAEWPNVAQSTAIAQKQALQLSENKIIRRISPYPWGLMAGRIANDEPFDWNKLQVKPTVKDVYWADPFLLKKQDKTYLFFEEYVHKTNRGRIAYALIDEQGNIGDPKTALERPYHLSYPFVFEHRGEFYMIPETAQQRTIEVYRCKSFPDQWEFHKVLIPDIHAADATLHEHVGRWWMFVNVAHEGGSTWDELHLYYSDDPLSSNWTPHPLNPVVSDVRSARPAGRIFRKDGGFVRPSQDSSLRYGYALNFNRILRLTVNEYEEELIERIEPNNENILGVHTYNTLGDIVVIDAKLKE